MNNIPPKLRERLAADPFYAVCSMRHLTNHVCKGKVTWEHSIIFAGSQLQERWAIIPLCEWGHSVNSYQDGPGLDKKKNIWIATQRATVEELRVISKALDYVKFAQKLSDEFGHYTEEECLAWRPTAPSTPLVKPDEQKKLAWNDRRRETFWLPLHDHAVRLMIQNNIDYHKIADGITYSPFEMVQKMIVDYDKETRELKKTNDMIDDFAYDASARQ